MNFALRPYDPWLAYGQSKTANVLFAVEATRRWAADGITANAVHPGAIRHQPVAPHGPRGAWPACVASGTYTFKTPEQGAATSVLVATCRRSRASAAATSRTATRPPVVDPATAARRRASPPTPSTRRTRERLWELSLAALSHR